MKTSKLVTSIGLAGAIAFGALIESADAQTLRRRTANTYSPTANDEATVTNQFTLVDTLLNGTTISDRALSDRNVSRFAGAIEDYAVGIGGVQICSVDTTSCPPSSYNSDSRYLYDPSGFPVFFEPFSTSATPFDGDLLVEFFEAGKDPLFPNLEINGSRIDTIAYTILESKTAKPVSTYRLRLQPEIISSILDFDRDRAINSLSYILDENLLGKTDRVFFQRDENDFSPGTFIYPTDINSRIPGLGSGDVLLQNKFEQNVSTTPVPEPGTILGTLAALATGALIKRAKQG